MNRLTNVFPVHRRSAGGANVDLSEDEIALVAIRREKNFSLSISPSCRTVNSTGEVSPFLSRLSKFEILTTIRIKECFKHLNHHDNL